MRRLRSSGSIQLCLHLFLPWGAIFNQSSLPLVCVQSKVRVICVLWPLVVKLFLLLFCFSPFLGIKNQRWAKKRCVLPSLDPWDPLWPRQRLQIRRRRSRAFHDWLGYCDLASWGKGQPFLVLHHLHDKNMGSNRASYKRKIPRKFNSFEIWIVDLYICTLFTSCSHLSHNCHDWLNSFPNVSLATLWPFLTCW